MADEDWRVTVTLPDEAHVQRVVQAVREHEVEQDVRHRLGDRVAVSADGPHIFLYTTTEVAARAAERVVHQLLEQRQLTAEFALDRWHPVEQEWENASAPLPQTGAEREAEHEHRVEEETRESLATGQAEWEVRVELPSRHAAVELAKRLEAEGRTVARRWKYVVAGANNEDDAGELAKAVGQEAPAGASVHSAPVPFVPFGLARFGDVPLMDKL
ncbi:MAG: hypothetical protein ACRDNF_18635 [Streptosporangiaceae bacterium]